MLVHGQPYRTVWLKQDDPRVVQIIDQRRLPHHLAVEDLTTVAEAAEAIAEMHVRRAGLIGAPAGYGMYPAALDAPRTSSQALMAAMMAAGRQLQATRPTVVNLEWAVRRRLAAVAPGQQSSRQLRLRRHCRPTGHRSDHRAGHSPG